MGTIRKAYLRMTNSEVANEFPSGTTFLPNTKVTLYAELNDLYYIPINTGILTFEAVENSAREVEGAVLKTYKVKIDSSTGYTDGSGNIIVDDPYGNGSGITVEQELRGQTELTNWRTVLGDYCLKFKYSVNGGSPVEYNTGGQLVRFILNGNDEPVTADAPVRNITYDTDKNNILFYVGSNKGDYKKGGYYTYRDSSTIVLGDHREIRESGVSFSNYDSHALIELKEVTLASNCEEYPRSEITETTLVRLPYYGTNENNTLKIVSYREAVEASVVFSEHCAQVTVNYFSPTTGRYISKIINPTDTNKTFLTYEGSSVFVETITDGDYRYTGDSYYVDVSTGSSTVTASCKAAETVDINIGVNSGISQISVTYWPSALGGRTPTDRVTTVYSTNQTLRLVKNKSNTNWSISLDSPYTAPSSYLRGEVNNYTGFFNSSTSQYELEPVIDWALISTDVNLDLDYSSTSQITINLQDFIGATSFYTNKLSMRLSGAAVGQRFIGNFDETVTIYTGATASGGAYSDRRSPRVGLTYQTTSSSPSLVILRLVAEGVSPSMFTGEASITTYQLRIRYGTGYISHEITPTAISISASPSTTIRPGESTRLKVDFTPSNASNFSDLAWSLSNNPKISLSPSPSTGLTSVVASPGQGDGGVTTVSAGIGSVSDSIDITYYIPISSYKLYYNSTELVSSSVVRMVKGGIWLSFTAELTPSNAQDSLLWDIVNSQNTSIADQFDITLNTQGTTAVIGLKSDSTLTKDDMAIVKVKTQDNRLEHTFNIQPVIPATSLALSSEVLYFDTSTTQQKTSLISCLPVGSNETISDIRITPSSDSSIGISTSASGTSGATFIHTRGQSAGSGQATFIVRALTSDTDKRISGTIEICVTSITLSPSTTLYLPIGGRQLVIATLSGGIQVPIQWVTSDSSKVSIEETIQYTRVYLQGESRELYNDVNITAYVGDSSSGLSATLPVRVYKGSEWSISAPSYVPLTVPSISSTTRISVSAVFSTPDTDELIDSSSWSLTCSSPSGTTITNRTAGVNSCYWDVSVPLYYGEATFVVSATEAYSGVTKTATIYAGYDATSISFPAADTSPLFPGSRTFSYTVSPSVTTNSISISLDDTYTGVSMSYDTSQKTITLTVASNVSVANVGITVEALNHDGTTTASNSITVPVSPYLSSFTVGPANNDYYIDVGSKNSGRRTIVVASKTPSGCLEVVPTTGWTSTNQSADISVPTISSSVEDRCAVFASLTNNGMANNILGSFKVKGTSDISSIEASTNTIYVGSPATSLTITRSGSGSLVQGDTETFTITKASNLTYNNNPVVTDAIGCATGDSIISKTNFDDNSSIISIASQTSNSFTIQVDEDVSSDTTVYVAAGAKHYGAIVRSIDTISNLIPLTISHFIRIVSIDSMTSPTYISSRGSGICEITTTPSDFDEDVNWTYSTDGCSVTSIVHLSKKKIVVGGVILTGSSAGSLTVTATGAKSGVTRTSQTIYVGVPATSIFLGQYPSTIYKGESKNFTFTVQPSDCTDIIGAELSGSTTGCSISNYSYSNGSGSFTVTAGGSASVGGYLEVKVKTSKQDSPSTTWMEDSTELMIEVPYVQSVSLVGSSPITVAYNQTTTAKISFSPAYSIGTLKASVPSSSSSALEITSINQSTKQIYVKNITRLGFSNLPIEVWAEGPEGISTGVITVGFSSS